MTVRHSSRRGFTIVELFVVIAIILVVMAIGLPIIMLTMQVVDETKVCREVKLLDQHTRKQKMK